MHSRESGYTRKYPALTQSFFMKNLYVGQKSSLSARKATKFQFFGRLMHTVFFISKDLSVVVPTPVELTDRRKQNNVYASTDPYPRIKILTIFCCQISVTNWIWSLSLLRFYPCLTEGAEVCSLMCAFTSVCMIIPTLFFFNNFHSQFYFQRSQSLANFFHRLFSTSNFYTTFYRGSILF